MPTELSRSDRHSEGRRTWEEDTTADHKYEIVHVLALDTQRQADRVDVAIDRNRL
jgi:hypothetical protein